MEIKQYILNFMKSKYRKLSILIISILLALILISNNFINIRKQDDNLKKIKTNNILKKHENIVTVYDMIGDSGIKAYIESEYEYYNGDLNIDNKQINLFKNVINQSLGLNLKDYIENDNEKVTKNNDNNLIYKTDDTKFIDKINNIISSNKDDAKIIESEHGYLIEVYDNLEHKLIPIIEELSNHDYLIAHDNIPIGILKIIKNGEKITLNIKLNNSKSSQYDFENILSIINKIPKGYPNSIIIFKNGTIDLSAIIGKISQDFTNDENSKENYKNELIVGENLYTLIKLTKPMNKNLKNILKN